MNTIPGVERPAQGGARAIRNRFRPVQQQVAGMPPAPPDPNDLTTQTYLPGNDPRLQGAQGATDAAGARVQGAPGYSQATQAGMGRYRAVFGEGRVQGGPAINAQDGGKYLAEQDAAIAGLGGPNRTELAMQSLKDFDALDAENRQKSYRSLTQNAAGAGRLGMMDEARKVLDTERTFNNDRSRFANELARSVSEGDISDRFRRVEATSGLRGQEAGIGQSIRAEGRDERDYGTGLDERNEDRRFRSINTSADLGARDAAGDFSEDLDKLSSARSLEDLVFGQGQQNRGEYRGERNYQDARRDNEINNRFRTRQLENDELDARIRRAMAMGG